MALVIPEGRVKESATVSGTDSYDIVGPAGATFLTFAAEVGNGNQVDYCAVDAAETEFEIGRGFVNVGTPTRVSRENIFASSNSGNIVNWPASTTVSIFAVLRGGVIKTGFHDLNGESLVISADGSCHLVESSGTPNLVRVTIGGLLAQRWQLAGGAPQLQLVWEDNGAAAGGFLTLRRVSTSAADGDQGYELQWSMQSNAGVERVIGAIRPVLVSATDGAENGALLFDILTGGTRIQAARLDTTQFLVGKQTAGIANVGVQAGIAGRLSCTMDGQDPLQVNRLTSDGQLVRFFKDSVEVGDISVASGTVSLTGFNGAHASEWGMGHAPEEEPPLGTVLSAVDEAMPGDSWMHPKVRITREPGDRAVYGVYAGRKESGQIQVWGAGIGAARVIGPVRNGDFLQPSALAGVAERQNDETPRPWTLGKSIRGDDRTDERLIPCTLKSA